MNTSSQLRHATDANVLLQSDTSLYQLLTLPTTQNISPRIPQIFTTKTLDLIETSF